MQAGQVFVSHTSDMAQFPRGRSFVQAVLDAVGRAGMAPVDMRYFAARDGSPAEYCRQRVAGCEVYVAVVGFRYGSLVPGEEVSYTELEFAAAGAAGLPRLVFLLEDDAGLPPGLADGDRAAVRGFRGRLREAGLVVRGFASADGLELEVFHALAELADGGPAPAEPGLAVRYSLPPDTAAFTGRSGELRSITAGAAAVAGAGGSPLAGLEPGQRDPAAAAGPAGAAGVIAITGMPGAGKTSLAVRAARLLRGRFPDRQLFIDLHGHTPGREPVTAHAALAGLLTAVGVDARYLPGGLEDRAGLWRDRMAGQRAVLVLDNAASSAQVAPLLPGGDACMVLVTSRRHLGDLPGPAAAVSLEALAPADAAAMLVRLAPRAAAGPAAAVAELAGLAGYLPLAISLLARVLARHPSWTLAHLAAETRASLLTLTAENDSVAAAFDVSYRHLPPGQQHLFRALGLHPGMTFGAHAVAALAGIAPADATAGLDALHGEGLLTETGYRRYGMHDLIRRYARSLAVADPAPGRAAALGRLMDYYQHAAGMAEAFLARHPRPSPPPAPARLPAGLPGLADRGQALEWARAECADLLACLDHAACAGQDDRVVALTAAIAALLRMEGPWDVARARHAAAAAAARRLRDRPGQAAALNNLGIARYLSGDNPGAAAALEEALAICRDLGDRAGQASALAELGITRYAAGDFPGAAAALEEALAICRDLGDRAGQASVLTDLGIARFLGGDYPAAAAAAAEAVAICRDTGEEMSLGHALSHTGMVRWAAGDYPAAAAAMEEALGIFRGLDYRWGQASCLGYLGLGRHTAGDYPGAAAALEEALRIFRETGARGRFVRASALCYLAVMRQAAGDGAGAAQALGKALDCYYFGTGGAGDAAGALNEAGTLLRARGDMGRAAACHQQARELARDARRPRDEARALAGLGRCALAEGRTADAQASLARARDILQRTGAAEADTITAELRALTGDP